MNDKIFRSKFKPAFVLLSFFFLSAFSFQSDAHRTSLIELYTSQGCSSCVTAEEQMKNFLVEKGLWKDFVPVAFHVDYWDYIGWKDRFATPAFTARQQAYNKKWKGSSVYTPSFVLNGEEWPEWFTTQEYPQRKKEAEVGILKAAGTPEKFSVDFTPKVDMDLGYEAHAALLGLNVRSNVTAGENLGRILDQNFVVLDYQKQKMEKSENRFQAHMKFEKLDTSGVGSYGMAVWVTPAENLTPLQATGGILKEVSSGKEA